MAGYDLINQYIMNTSKLSTFQHRCPNIDSDTLKTTKPTKTPKIPNRQKSQKPPKIPDRQKFPRQKFQTNKNFRNNKTKTL
jgi:hypothetical protein